jgi:hypothetical protein
MGAGMPDRHGTNQVYRLYDYVQKFIIDLKEHIYAGYNKVFDAQGNCQGAG